MNTPKSPLHLFQGFGVELEYMIVDKSNLSVQPIADKLLYKIAGEFANEIELGEIAWSNELVMHVIELKTNGPAKTLHGLSQHFHRHIQDINKMLNPHDAMLLPTGAHPFMSPHHDTKIWPHEYNEIYDAYNRIFDCRGHGWSNLQSTHLNLPFANDDEFARLHTAIRLLLPIIPALAASTPIIDGKYSGYLDTRMELYRKNQEKIPSITGHVIPEVILSIAEYHEKILKRIYKDIDSFDQQKVLQHEWINSRGAIARFDRNAIEIRVIDIQECAHADLAVLSLIIATLKFLIAEKWQLFSEQLKIEDNMLSKLFISCVHEGQSAVVPPEYTAIFSPANNPLNAKELWQQIFKNLQKENQIESEWDTSIRTILTQGTLAERIMKYVGYDNDSKKMSKCYFELASCLEENKQFIVNHV
jgi:gamma-glutamyl:cysteine ligase YbdK (ATP-grasp superfamily)